MKKIAPIALLLVVLFGAWFVVDGGRKGPEVVENEGAGAALAEEIALPGLAAIEEVPEQGRAAASSVESEVAGEPSAPAARPASGALHVRLKWSDGLPAVGQGVIVTNRFAKVGVTHRMRHMTDGAGVARFGDLTPGEYKVSTFRTKDGDELKVTVTAGQTEVLEVEIAASLQVVGRVTNADGEALVGAEIWVESTPGGWTSGEVAAVTDEAGEYRIRDLPPSPSLGALAVGYAPSALQDLDLVDKSLVPVRMDFVVSPGGGSLEGVVTDAEGAPVEGAVVAAGEHDGTYDMRFNDTVTETWTFRHTTTGADGRYRFGALVVGDLPLAVRKAGHPQWSGSVVIERLQTLHQDISLDSGAVVSGVVTDTDGAPVEAARIQAFPGPLSESYLQSGQVDYDAPFGQAVALTASDGSYTLEPLPHRPMFLYAMQPRPERHSRGDLMQFTKIEIDLSGGGQRTWDPVLSDGPVIEGVVRYRDGGPIENIFVSVLVTEGVDGSRRALHTPTGAFKFIQLPGAAYTVRAQIWDLPEGCKEPQLLGVTPGSQPIELVADFDAPVDYESSRITVRLSDAANRATGASVSITLENQASYSWQFGEQDSEGVWTFHLDQPGSYRPIALMGERLIAAGEVFESTPGEDLDLGVLRTEPGGVLTLHVSSSEEHPPVGVKGTLTFGGVRHSENFQLGAVSPMRLEGVEPGPGKVTFYGENTLMRSHEFEITAGEETVLDVELVPAVGVPYRIDLPTFEGSMSLELRFIDLADGSDAGHSGFKDLARYPRRIEFEKMLGLGSYRMEAELSDGRRKDVEFEVRSLKPDEAPRAEVDLR